MTAAFVSAAKIAQTVVVNQPKFTLNVDNANDYLTGLVSEGDKKELLSLQFVSETGNQPLFSSQFPETLTELLGVLHQDDSKDKVNSMAYFRSNPFVQCKTRKDIIWKLPTLDENRKRVELDVKILTYKARGVKGSGKCGKCGSTEVVYGEKQTRGGDEAATIFAKCAGVGCDNKWRM